MAILKLSGFVTGISGSVGGNVFKKNRNGTSLQVRSKSCSSSTIRQQQVHSQLKYLRAYWFRMEAKYRNSYNFSNRNGQSGIELFLSANFLNINGVGSVVQFVRPPNLVILVYNARVELNQATGIMTLITSIKPGAESYVQISATSVQSKGVNQSSRNFKVIGYSFANVNLNLNITSMYTNVFGARSVSSILSGNISFSLVFYQVFQLERFTVVIDKIIIV